MAAAESSRKAPKNLQLGHVDEQETLQHFLKTFTGASQTDGGGESKRHRRNGAGSKHTQVNRHFFHIMAKITVEKFTARAY